MQTDLLPGKLCRNIVLFTVLPPDNTAAAILIQISRCDTCRSFFPCKGNGSGIFYDLIDLCALCQYIFSSERSLCMVAHRRFRFRCFFYFPQIVKLVRLRIPVQHDLLFLWIPHIPTGSLQLFDVIFSQIKPVRWLTVRIFAGESDITTLIRHFTVDQHIFFMNRRAIILTDSISGIQSIHSACQRFLC